LRASQRPDDSALQHEEAQQWRRVGNIEQVLLRTNDALQAYERARELFGALVHSHPDVRYYADSLARTCFNRARLLLQMNRPKETLVDLDEGLRQTDRLGKLDPKNPMSVTLLLVGLPRRAALLARLGRGEQADADWQRVLKIAPVAQLAGLRLQRAVSRAQAGDYLRAAAEAEELAAEGVPAGTLYDLACIHAVDAVASGKDAARPLPEREKRAEQYARVAVALLRRLARAGYFRDAKRVEHLDKDEDFAGLREREDYRAFRQTLKLVKR
jgi:tetratricopeptide (TPR) repeat protein